MSAQNGEWDPGARVPLVDTAIGVRRVRYPSADSAPIHTGQETRQRHRSHP